MPGLATSWRTDAHKQMTLAGLPTSVDKWIHLGAVEINLYAELVLGPLPRPLDLYLEFSRCVLISRHEYLEIP
jgi:hypothetical protein